MGEPQPGAVERVLAMLYIGLVFADLMVVADVLSGGNLHRWCSRRARVFYRWATEPVQQEAEVRREAAWVIWEAMQLLEEAQP